MTPAQEHRITGRLDYAGHAHFSCSCAWSVYNSIRDEVWKAEETIRHWAVNQPGSGGSLGVRPRLIEGELSPARLAQALGAPVTHGRVELYVAGDQVGVWGLGPFAHRAPIGSDSAGVEGSLASLFLTEHEARAEESRARREYGVPATPQRAFRVSVPVDDLRIPDWPDWPWGQRRFHARTFDVADELAPADALAAALTRTDLHEIPARDPGDETMITRDPNEHRPQQHRRWFSLRRKQHVDLPGGSSPQELGTEEAPITIEPWEEEGLAYLDQLNAEADAQRAAEEAERAAEREAEDVELSVACEAADSGAVADLAAAYGGLYDGYAEARAEQAAARELLPDLPPAIRTAAAELETRKGRPVTLAEVRWLEHCHSHAQRELGNGPSTPAEAAGNSTRHSQGDAVATDDTHQASRTRGRVEEQRRPKGIPGGGAAARRGAEVRR